MTKPTMSWPERFALLDHYKPQDSQVCSAFNITKDELDVARMMRDAGVFAPSKTLDVAAYANVFSANPGSEPTVATPTIGKSNKSRTGGSTTHVKPESVSKRVKVPQKRGRKGSKIATALLAVTTTQVPVETFIAQHGVSLAVLRQSKRFIDTLDPALQKQIGRVNVRQDAATKRLMIWREDV
jgi:hypothetical protein